AEVNLTSMMEFVLLGFSDIPNFQIFLFVIFFFVYVVILMGNGVIILITMVDQALQTPMYFFLSNFSFLEICFVSVTLPRMLTNLWTQKRNISLFACATQMSFVLTLGHIECLLLTVMAYDRYVAICNPLHYPLVMNHKVCVQMVAACWITGVPNQLKKEISNITTLVEFVLLGFSDIPNLHWVLFGIFLVIYLTILMCNSIIILITRIDSALQTPMYFFLSNFSFLEICYVTVTIPRMLIDLLTQKGNISFLACAAQMCFVLMFGGSECLLLTVMAYDRYVAICNPLHYPLIMNPRKCVQLVTISWVSDVPFVIGQTCQIFSLPFCGSNVINHFFCDIPPIFKLTCGDTFVNEIAVYVVAVIFIMVPFLLIVVSYGKIICSILKLSSAKGRAKAFSTCSSHL
ncbi:O10AG protein, partial [Crocuta crocuta]